MDTTTLISGAGSICTIAALLVYVITSIARTPDKEAFKNNMEVIMGLSIGALVFVGVFVATIAQSDVYKWQYLYFIYHLGFVVAMVSLAVAIFAQYTPLPPA